MKLPLAARKLTRRAIGVGNSRAITPDELHALAREGEVIVIGVGVFMLGSIDPRLPGTQRAASLLSLKSVVADVPRQQAIALHCG